MSQKAELVVSDIRPRYLDQIAPLVFPEEAEVPETQLHFELRILLYQLLSDYLGVEATVGSDQFVYYAADDPKQSVAPDVYVRLLPRGEPIRSWKTWERGAPDVAVELVSASDAPEDAWAQKLTRYHRLGVRELVRFNPQLPEQPLRIWDRVNDNLLERELTGLRSPSLVLPISWVVAPAEGHAIGLRITDGRNSSELVLTRGEAWALESRSRKVELHAREAAEQRIAELEAELRRRGG
jgi:Uma2 family endonuclease